MSRFSWPATPCWPKGSPAKCRRGTRSPLSHLPLPAGFTPGPLTGNIALAEHSGVSGWAMDELHRGIPVALEIIADGRVLATALADHRRPDLEMAGLGNGSCGFAVRFAHPLPADRNHILSIRRIGDGADVPGSPLLLRKPLAAPELLAAITSPEAGAGSEFGAADIAAGIDRLLQSRLS